MEGATQNKEHIMNININIGILVVTNDNKQTW
jgi:hypothetical protein